MVVVQKRVFEVDGVLSERVLVLSRAWERPAAADGRPLEEWIVPVDDVKQYIWALAAELHIAAIQFDPAFITWEAGKLAAAGLAMREFPQHMVRMGAASQSLYELVLSRVVCHDGDPVLARHVANAVAKQQRSGSASWRLEKGAAKRKMDACIALAMAIWSLQHPGDEPKAPKKGPNSYGLDDEELDELLGVEEAGTTRV